MNQDRDDVQKKYPVIPGRSEGTPPIEEIASPSFLRFAMTLEFGVL